MQKSQDCYKVVVMRSSVIISCFVISYCLIVQISSRIFRMTFCKIVEVNLAW